jgi:four helix bundle protein
VKDYRELVVWQISDELRREVYRLLGKTSAGRDFQFADQLRGSVSGIPSNIAEGFRRFGSVEFARYLEMAFASSGETANWLDDGIARRHWTEAEVANARLLLRRLDPALTHLMRYLRSPAARKRSRRT